MAEPGVRVPVCLLGLHAQDEMAARPRVARRGADPDPGEQRSGPGPPPSASSAGLEQQVLLEAVAAAALIDELALEVLELERDRDPAARIEVLERDRGDVRAVQLGQSRAAAQPDAREIRVEVEHGARL